MPSDDPQDVRNCDALAGVASEVMQTNLDGVQLVVCLQRGDVERIMPLESRPLHTMTTLRERLIKIGAKVTRHAKYVTFQLAEVAVTRSLFAAILDRIARLAIPPPLVT